MRNKENIKDVVLGKIQYFLSAPEIAKDEKRILREASSIILQLEAKINDIDKKYKMFEWEIYGRVQMAKDSERKYGKMVHHLRRLVKENKEIITMNKNKDKKINKLEKQKERLKYRLYKKWNKLKKWFKKKLKKKIKKLENKRINIHNKDKKNCE